MLKAKKKDSVPVADYIREYVRLREEKKSIEKRMKQISDVLKSYAVTNGQKDDKGSSYFERDDYVVGNVARKSVSFNIEKATQFFRRKGYPECIDTIEVINESAVEELLSTGEISIDDLASITDTKVSYSIDIKPVDKSSDGEVEEHTVRRGNRA